MKSQTGTAEKKTNKPSALLSPEENEQVFALLGRRCQVSVCVFLHSKTVLIIEFNIESSMQTMCTAVAKLFTTEGPVHSDWHQRQTGALCFVRDSAKRSYFMRLYCLIKCEMVWEEEMYDAIYINQSKEWLLDFEGRVRNLHTSAGSLLFNIVPHIQDSLVALDFASELEASNFYKTATATIANRSKRRQVNSKLINMFCFFVIRLS